MNGCLVGRASLKERGLLKPLILCFWTFAFLLAFMAVFHLAALHYTLHHQLLYLHLERRI